MKETEVINILALVRGNWYRQPGNDETLTVWAELLAEVDYQAAASAVRAYIASGDAEPPTPGQVAKLAVDTAARWRQEQRKLPEPEIPMSERQRNIKFLRDITEAIGDREKLIRVYGEFMHITLEAAEEELYRGQRAREVGEEG